MVDSFSVDFIQNFTSQSEAFHSSRKTAVTGNLKQYVLQFLNADSVVQCSTKMQLEFMGTSQGCEHAKIQDASLFAVQSITAPDFPPAVFVEHFLKFLIEVIGLTQRTFNIFCT